MIRADARVPYGEIWIQQGERAQLGVAQLIFEDETGESEMWIVVNNFIPPGQVVKIDGTWFASYTMIRKLQRIDCRRIGAPSTDEGWEG